LPGIKQLAYTATVIFSLQASVLLSAPQTEELAADGLFDRLVGDVAGDLVEGVRVGRHADKTRLVIDLAREVQYRYQRGDNELVFELAWSDESPTLDSATVMTSLDFAKTAVSGVSIQRQEGGGARITIALVQPARAESFDLQPYADRSYRLVVDVFYKDSNGNEEYMVATAAVANKSVTSGHIQVPEEKLVVSSGVDTESIVASVSSMAASSLPPNKRDTTATSSESTNTSFSGTWEHEWAINSVSGQSQKFESMIEPEWDVSFSNGIKATIVGRLRFDGVGDLGPNAYTSFNYSQASAPLYNTQAASLTLRELYFDIPLSNSYLRLGKQQVVWGESDGIKVLDVVNPQSFREFILDDFEDSRIPLWMVNWELPLGDSANLQVLWIPDLNYDELAEAGTPYFVTSPQLVPDLSSSQSIQFLEPEKPDDIWQDGDWGLKLSSLVGNWDVSLQYLYQYGDAPVFYRYRGEDLSTVVAPAYERTHLVGSTFSNTFSDFTVRAELAYKSDTFQISDNDVNDGIETSSEFSSVLGLDWQASSDVLLSAQWFYSFLLDYERSIVRDENEQIASLLFQSDFNNGNWQLQALSLYSLNNKDMLFQFKLRYWLYSNMEIWIGSDMFRGTQRGLFGQFDEQDRVLMGFNYGF
jgi:hypothetical protein